MKKILTVLLALIVVAVLLAGLAMFAGHAITESRTNLRYVYVGDTNVSGLTREETEQLLIERGRRYKQFFCRFCHVAVFLNCHYIFLHSQIHWLPPLFYDARFTLSIRIS